MSAPTPSEAPKLPEWRHWCWSCRGVDAEKCAARLAVAAASPTPSEEVRVGPKGDEPGCGATRPEEIAQPSPRIEPAEYSDEWLLQRARKAQATIDSLPPDLRATFYAASATLPALPTTPTEGPAQTLTDAAELAAEVIRVAESEAELLKDEGMLPESMGALRVADRLRRAIESKVRAGTLTDPEGAS